MSCTEEMSPAIDLPAIRTAPNSPVPPRRAAGATSGTGRPSSGILGSWLFHLSDSAVSTVLAIRLRLSLQRLIRLQPLTCYCHIPSTQGTGQKMRQPPCRGEKGGIRPQTSTAGDADVRE